MELEKFSSVICGYINKVFNRLKREREEKSVGSPFRYRYAKRAHKPYKLSDLYASSIIAHTTAVHNKDHSEWGTESMLGDSMKER